MPPQPPAAAPSRPGPLARLRERVSAARPWVRWTVLAVALVVLGGGAVGAVLLAQRHEQRQRRQDAADQWTRFDTAAKAGDEAEMLAALDAVAALTADPACDRYRAAVTSGVAPADDERLCLLTTTLHARRGRWAEAGREAEKRLAHDPDDWLARCLVALAAVNAGDLTAAGGHLDRLPDPARAGPTPSGLLLAAELFRHTARDPAPLRRFVNDVVVEVVGSVGVQDDPPAAKAELIDCYLLGFTGPPGDPLPARLGSAIAGVVRLADDAAGSDDPAVLVRVGLACNRLAAALDRLHQAKQLTAAQRDGLGKEHDARTERVWRAVKAKAPTTPAAYHGLAVGHVRAGHLDLAVDEVRAGLGACGDDPHLLALYSLLLRATGNTDSALRKLGAAAEKDPTNIPLLLLVVETALEVPRRDVAAVALKHAILVAPTDPRVVRADVRSRLAGGDPHGAVQRLRELGEPAVLADPALVRAYTRAQADAGLAALCGEWLEQVEKRATATAQPAAVAAAARGLADARFDADLARPAVALVDRTLVRWPGDTDLLVARALLLARWAEWGSPRWEAARTREAVFAVERLRAIAPDDPDAAALLARVRLQGANDPAKAEQDAAPLAAVRDRGGLLTADQAVVLGLVLLATGQTEPAVAALEQARKLAPPTAGVLIPLARAYHARGQTDRGKELLAEARRLPRTPQDDADLRSLPAPLRDSP